jgi:ferric-dicitrate binding protein FerR (iron transport regulator)
MREMENELLIKLILGLCSHEENYAIMQLLEEDENLRKEYADLKNAYALSRGFTDDKPEELISEYKSIHKKINRIRFRSILRYAAVLLLAFCSGGVFFYLFTPKGTPTAGLKDGMKTMFIVPLGQTAEVILPDSSRVLMNSGSTLSYPPNFSSNNRGVELIGEAFFVVKKDHLHPFIVKTSSVNIKVLGTSFNVEAYNDKFQEVNTTLISGKVEIETLTNKKLAELTPGLMGSYKKSNQSLSLSKVDINLYTSWKKGLLTFSDVPLQTITGKMERWYNVKIIYQNPKLKNLRYSGAILKNKPIDQILEVMKITANIQYKINFRSNKPSIIYLN